LVPAVTAAGPVFVTARSADVTIVVFTVELSLAGLESLALVTDAVLLTLEPLAALALACTTSVKVTVLLAAIDAAVSVIVPPLPGAGVVAVKPAAGVMETNVAPAGTVSVSDTFCASLGPLLVKVIVYVTLVPAVATAGPVLLTARSAEVVTDVVTTVEVLLAGLESVVAL